LVAMRAAELPTEPAVRYARRVSPAGNLTCTEYVLPVQIWLRGLDAAVIGPAGKRLMTLFLQGVTGLGVCAVQQCMPGLRQRHVCTAYMSAMMPHEWIPYSLCLLRAVHCCSRHDAGS
jgi:hypothetical protein